MNICKYGFSPIRIKEKKISNSFLNMFFFLALEFLKLYFFLAVTLTSKCDFLPPVLNIIKFYEPQGLSPTQSSDSPEWASALPGSSNLHLSFRSSCHSLRSFSPLHLHSHCNQKWAAWRCDCGNQWGWIICFEHPLESVIRGSITY